MCANDKCGRNICRSCMNDNMKERVEQIEADDNWRCFYCRPRQLRHFKKALRIGQEQSIYSWIKNEGDEVEQLEIRLELLDVIVGSIKEGRKALSTDSLKYREKKVRKELESSGSIHLIKEEMENVEAGLRRHLDILEIQEATLAEEMSCLGYVQPMNEEQALQESIQCGAGCGNKGDKICQCRAERYCSKECQRANWRAHKPICRQHRQVDIGGRTDSSELVDVYPIGTRGQVQGPFPQDAMRSWHEEGYLHPDVVQAQTQLMLEQQRQAQEGERQKQAMAQQQAQLQALPAVNVSALLQASALSTFRAAAPGA
ncbi:hypothetical protein B484DRAFT_403248 [Ochromonadaceae sp. CCMP2298]|nr:hypothetical protein B484DRAFT_403248 [Ochromonadaceae sp. CCMP2298]